MLLDINPRYCCFEIVYLVDFMFRSFVTGTRCTVIFLSEMKENNHLVFSVFLPDFRICPTLSGTQQKKLACRDLFFSFPLVAPSCFSRHRACSAQCLGSRYYRSNSVYILCVNLRKYWRGPCEARARLQTSSISDSIAMRLPS